MIEITAPNIPSYSEKTHKPARPVEKRMMRRHLILLPLPLFIHAIFPLFFLHFHFRVLFTNSTSPFKTLSSFTSTSRFYSPIPHPHFSLHFHFQVLFTYSTSAFFASLPLPRFIHPLPLSVFQVLSLPLPLPLSRFHSDPS